MPLFILLLSISAGISGGGYRYYSELAREDYYLEGGEPPGEWFGKAATFFGLTGKVEKQALQELFRGYANGFPLSQNAGNNEPDSLGRKPVRAYDLTYNAPKSVSLARFIAPRTLGAAIEKAHDDSVRDAISKIEATGAFARLGYSGRGGLIHCDIIAAIFRHSTNRNLEAHLHSHCLVGNGALSADGNTRSLHGPALFQKKMENGAYYQRQFAKRLERLGLSIEWHGQTFEICGISAYYS